MSAVAEVAAETVSPTARCVKCGLSREWIAVSGRPCYPGDKHESFGVHGFCPPPSEEHGPFEDEAPAAAS